MKEMNDFAEQADFIKNKINSKPFLKKIYIEAYEKFRDFVNNNPGEGQILEIGSGAGFIKEFVPETITSDVIAYPGIDQVIDATQIPFEDSSLRIIYVFHSFHHIPDVEKFLSEAQRCLKPGGKLLIVDPHVGIISTPINKYLHHEGFDKNTPHWKFESKGPLSDANNALAWIVFKRDQEIFNQKFNQLQIRQYSTHSALKYWVSGGLMNWTLAPGWAFELVTWIDRLLSKVYSGFDSFVDVVIEKKK